MRLDDAAGLVGFVAHRDQPRFCAGRPLGPEILGETLLCQVDHAIGGGKDRLRRAVVTVERDDFGGRRELPGEVEDVAHGRGAERIDRLGVVADHGEAASARFQRQQDRRLQPVGVLIFVDQHMIEPAADVVGKRRIAHGLRPVQQQVVVIEHVLALLGLDIGCEQLFQLSRPSRAPRKRGAQHLFDRRLRIDAARIDRETGAFCGKTLFGFGKSLFVPDQIDQVGGILAVVNREGGIEADLLGMFAQQPRADAVKGAGPGQRVGHDAGIVAQHLPRDSLDACFHFGSCAAGKRHQQDAAGIGAADDQMGDAMRQRVGLAGAGAGNHQQGRTGASFRRAVLDGAPLFGIETFEIGGCRWHGISVLGGQRSGSVDFRRICNHFGTCCRRRISGDRRSPNHRDKSRTIPYAGFFDAGADAKFCVDKDRSGRCRSDGWTL